MKLLRINAVAELLAVPAPTLRAWERRYGVPSPARTASAYRLYGEGDVAAIRRMRDLVADGVAPAEAARQVRVDNSLPSPPDLAASPYEIVRDRIVDATIAMEPDAVALEVGRALGMGSALAAFEGAIAPALERVGELWHAGEISVAHEHLASQVIGTAVADAARLVQPHEAPRRALLACFADDDHQLALQGVALRFASWGYRTIVLGPRIPPAALGRAVETLAPDIVGLSATIAPEPARARELVDAYADACSSTVWVVGGRACAKFAERVQARGGIVASSDPSALRQQIEQAFAARRSLK